MIIHQVYLSVGSNLGDPMRNCCHGIELLSNNHHIAMITRSPFYKTQPVDYLDQAWFINAALRFKTDLSPFELLLKTQAIQHQIGRKKDGVRFGPRILDLDIIFYDDQLIDTPNLVVPHPRAHERRFVLQPICDIDPQVVHPVFGQTVQTILNQIPKENQELLPCLSGC